MRIKADMIWTTAGLAMAGAFAVRVLAAALSAFSWQNFLFSDYGVYTNTVWNLSRGHGFAFLIDHSYLTTHLSFSLALLAPLFRIYDSPLLLIFVQWAFMVGGGAIWLRLMRRLSVPWPVAAAVLAFWVAYPYTQSVLLSQFHGVSAYLLLVPWLVYCLCCARRWIVLPWLCLLGLREEVGLLLSLVFVYFAVKERWRMGYVYAALSVAYSAVAVLVLYPLLTGESLFAIRQSETSVAGVRAGLTGDAVLVRLRALFWLYLPCMPFVLCIRRGWRPFLVLPLIPLLITMLSGFPRQYALRFHYPAVLTAWITAAMVVAWRQAGGLRRGQLQPALCGALLGTTLAAHALFGFFWAGGNTHQVYEEFNANGKALLALSRRCPKEGILVAEQRIAPYFANRAQITTWRYWSPSEHPAELIACHYGAFLVRDDVDLMGLVRSGEFGVIGLEAPFALLKRGGQTELNHTAIAAVERLAAEVGARKQGTP